MRGDGKEGSGVTLGALLELGMLAGKSHPQDSSGSKEPCLDNKISAQCYKVQFPRLGPHLS